MSALAAGIVSSGLNALMQAHTNAYNREQAQYAYGQEMQAVQRMNEYNSPAQQVLRMKAAGLNPSLAYGADGALVGNQASTPAFSAIPAESPQIGNIGSMMNDAIRTQVEVRDLERRNALAVADIALKDAQSFQAITSGELNNASASEILNLMGYKMENLESSTQLNWEQVLKTREEISNLKESRKEIQSRVKLNEQQIKTLASQYHLNETQAYRILQMLPKEMLLMDAQAALDWAQTDVGRAEFAKINREISHIGFVEWANSRDFDFNVNSTVATLKMRKYETQVGVMNHLQDNFARVIGFGVGASALSSRQSAPMSAPSSSPSSGYEYGTFGTYGD